MKNTNIANNNTHYSDYTNSNSYSRSFLKRNLNTVGYTTTANLFSVCIDFYVYFPKTAQSTLLKTLCNVPQFSNSKSCPKK